MDERLSAVTIKGKPFSLIGKEIQVGAHLPEAELVDNNFLPVKLSAYLGKICIISVVHSLETSICDQQTHKFNEASTKFGSDVIVLTISMDLPFTQKKWCGNANLSQAITLSDHKEASFGKAFGLLIKELRLLGRGVFVFDKKGTLRYAEYLKEVAEHPQYEKALQEVEKLTRTTSRV